MANKSFWVTFRHGPNRVKVNKAMTGSSARQVAFEVRQKYKNVVIDSIHVNSHVGSSSYRSSHA